MKLLFVCLGNICRSPTAHGVMLKKLQDADVNWVDVDSAGTAAYHIGKTPDSRTQQAASSMGYDLSLLRARQISENDFFTYDYIFAMDQENLLNLKQLQPNDSTAKLTLALDHTEGSVKEVPDPYYGGEDGFEQVLMLCEQLCDGILENIVMRSSQ